jgi:hypothetical protein
MNFFVAASIGRFVSSGVACSDAQNSTHWHMSSYTESYSVKKGFFRIHVLGYV